jgi:hypothetical protein
VRLLVLLLASAGCRQLLGLEEAVVDDAATTPIDEAPEADAPAGGHDEDSDGVVDTVDNCPTIANTTQAVTAIFESVGSACDPRADSPGDRIAAFYSFAENVRPAGIQGGDTFALDRATFDGGELATQMSHTPSRVSAIISYTALLAGNASVELRLGTYFCRIGECAGSDEHCLRANGSNAVGETDVVIAPSFRFEMDQTGGSIVCRYVAADMETSAMALATAIETDKARIRSSGAVVAVDSFIVYDIAP